MKNNIFHLTSMAQWTIQQYLMKGDIALDATCGNGHDTLFLAQTVGENGHVFAFDIQEAACKSTKSLLQENAISDNVSIFNQSHDSLLQYIPPKFHKNIAAIMFNLGYLPQSDKTVRTSAVTTCAALEQSCILLKKGGIITIAVYVGHDGGKQEMDAIQSFVKHLPTQDFAIAHLSYPYTSFPAPELYIIHKRGT